MGGRGKGSKVIGYKGRAISSQARDIIEDFFFPTSTNFLYIPARILYTINMIRAGINQPIQCTLKAVTILAKFQAFNLPGHLGICGRIVTVFFILYRLNALYAENISTEAPRVVY